MEQLGHQGLVGSVGPTWYSEIHHMGSEVDEDSEATCFLATSCVLSSKYEGFKFRRGRWIRNGCYLTGDRPYITTFHDCPLLLTVGTGYPQPEPTLSLSPPFSLSCHSLPPSFCTFSFFIPESPPSSSTIEIPLNLEAPAQTWPPMKTHCKLPRLNE